MFKLLEEINNNNIRKDLPELMIGDIVEITSNFFDNNNIKINDRDKGQEKKKIKKEKFLVFKGTIIAKKNPKSISYSFSVINSISKKSGKNKIIIRTIFFYHSPSIISIKKIGKSDLKIRRAKLFYWERKLAKKKDNE